MGIAWKVPTGDDIWKVVSRSVVLKANSDEDGHSDEGNDLPEDVDTRASEAMRMAVQEVRAAIKQGHRVGVSLTPGSVPPEGEWHTLVIAAFRLILPLPNLLAIVMADGGIYAPLRAMHKDAQDWVKAIGQGEIVEEPVDPAGEDGTTAVSDENPAVSAVRWGDAQGTSREGTAGEIDMTTDGPMSDNSIE